MPCHGQDLLLFQEADGANGFVDSNTFNVNVHISGHCDSDSRWRDFWSTASFFLVLMSIYRIDEIS